MEDPEPVEYVLVERERLQRLIDAALLGRDDDELFPSNLEPGDLDDPIAIVIHPAPPTD